MITATTPARATTPNSTDHRHDQARAIREHHDAKAAPRN
jgi:hypothetical protein